jgi:hypothetical protein
MAWLTGWCILISVYLYNLVSTNCNTFSSKLYHVNVLTVHAMTVCRKKYKIYYSCRGQWIAQTWFKLYYSYPSKFSWSCLIKFHGVEINKFNDESVQHCGNLCLRNKIIFTIINAIFNFNIQCLRTNSLYVQGQTVCEMKGIISYVYGSTTLKFVR